ncbi:MAG: glycosyltransferase family 2 protein [Clostridia bacterium]|nr:glycosyltransferase family 2 protein [Clostridia bacterium]
MISVVVPVYNMRNYLSKCMDSLLNQTHQDYEILLVDDGSTDGSGEACDREAERSEIIRVVHKENGGLSSARNCGLDHARGEYIIFPDPDDWVEPNYLEHLMTDIEKEKADLSICGFFRFYAKEESIFKLPPRAVLDTRTALDRLVLPSDFSGYAWNKLFSMKIIQEAGLRFDKELLSLQDLHFCFRYFQHCARIVCDPVPLYHYNINSGTSAITSPITKRNLSAFKAYEKIAALAAETPWPELVRAEHGQMFERSLKYLYPYYWNKTDQPELLEMLKDNLKRYKNDFFSTGIHSWRFNGMARLALVSPKAYYLLLRAIRKATGQE